MPVIVIQTSDSKHSQVQCCTIDFQPSKGYSPQRFSELNDLTRDLHLSKEVADYLVPRLTEKNTAERKLFYWPRIEIKAFVKHFIEDKNKLILFMFQDI